MGTWGVGCDAGPVIPYMLSAKETGVLYPYWPLGCSARMAFPQIFFFFGICPVTVPRAIESTLKELLTRMKCWEAQALHSQIERSRNSTQRLTVQSNI